jgi:hypothetical protein
MTALPKGPKRIADDTILVFLSKDLNEISEHATDVAEVVMCLRATAKKSRIWTCLSAAQRIRRTIPPGGPPFASSNEEFIQTQK